MHPDFGLFLTQNSSLTVLVSLNDMTGAVYSLDFGIKRIRSSWSECLVALVPCNVSRIDTEPLFGRSGGSLPLL